MDAKLGDFSRHLDDVNVDFKENIMKKVEMIKLKDTDDLRKKVTAVKVITLLCLGGRGEEGRVARGQETEQGVPEAGGG
jgi:hypothetical protein